MLIIETDLLKEGILGRFSWASDGDGLIEVEQTLSEDSKRCVIAHEKSHMLNPQVNWKLNPTNYSHYYQRLKKMGRRRWLRMMLDDEVKAFRAQARALREGDLAHPAHVLLYEAYHSLPKAAFREFIFKMFKPNGMHYRDYYSKGLASGIKRLETYIS